MSYNKMKSYLLIKFQNMDHLFWISSQQCSRNRTAFDLCLVSWKIDYDIGSIKVKVFLMEIG